MRINRNFLFISLFTLIITFVILSILVIRHPVPALDISISLFIQKFHSDTLDKIMLAISFFGELPWSLLMVLVVAAVFFLFKYRRESYFITSILLSGLVILGIKSVIDRPRPTAFYVRLVEINRFQSFPSGHVMSYVLFFGFIIILMKTMKNIPANTRKSVIYISAFLMVAIPFSRVYLGAHWPSDTIGGFILGLICLFPLCYFYFKKKRG
ncbi:phosphatase PAP2 family protein [Pedobacter polaris]|uniref:Phosphatase PAP2 family protein n=1 Tax=Pedobacter polaris TaxID=2571273 RepID=A0A4U1CWM4_9SPHI|nr:phosphatase PAP2 family protein [Pedobacter polaris]TKC10719.1 phosphatase PAP2 family protein [Pedobacter polaris]